MSPTRREAFRITAASLCGMAIAGSSARADDAAGPEMIPLDYGRSFICNTAEFNAVRFWVESRTRIIDDAAGTWTDYYQCGSCKSEHTFAERDLFQQDNYDFLPILGNGEWLVFRRPAREFDRYRTIAKTTEMWGEPALKLVEAAKVSELDTWEKIRDATAAAAPIFTQTEIANEETGLRAIIECPTKTMNVSLDERLYQVDTGPIAYPDLTKRHEPEIDCLSLAFIAFNASHFADFVVEQLTPIDPDAPEPRKVYHYSGPFSVPAKNRVYAQEGLT